jgi:hypothetical protein
MIRRFAGPNISFVIYVDAKVDAGAFQKLKVDLAPFEAVFYAKRRRSRWGSLRI